jgi:2-(1,2-epoxy-1,2-dihydrophenyl)acetyl-CoA isomerase
LTDEPHLQVQVTGAVGRITLNRPAVLNALSPEMTDGLIEATRRFERDPEVRCVVIRGNGKAFMAGGDVKGMHRSLADARDQHLAQFEQRVIRAHQIIYQLRRMNKPVLAAVHGAIAGFGCGLLMAADLVLARSDSYLTLAYRHIGLTVDGGISYFLPRIVGERRALELALLGDKISAAYALELGIVNWVAEEARFEDEVEAMTQRLASGPTMALGRIKQLYRTSLESSWDEQSHREAEGIAFAGATRDHAEGVAAFVEKRKAIFTGA